jgi:hypothetical protein
MRCTVTEPSIPIHEFFGAIYGHFFRDEQGQPSALYDGVHRALQEERFAGLARTLMDYVAGDVEVQWIGEDEGQDEGASFTLATGEGGGLDVAGLARNHSAVYAEAFQVAVARLAYRERPAYHAYFGLVLDVFEQCYGPGSAPVRVVPSA